MSLLTIKADLARSWKDAPAYDTCLEIVDFVANHKSHLKIITYRTLLNALGRSTVDQELLTALTILVSSRVHLLDACAFFYDGDQEFELSSEDWSLVRRHGELAHPVTGSLVTDFEQKTVPFFTPSSRVLSDL